MLVGAGHGNMLVEGVGVILFFGVMCRANGDSGEQQSVGAEGQEEGLKKNNVKNWLRSLICHGQIRSQKWRVRKLYGVVQELMQKVIRGKWLYGKMK